MSFTRNPGLAPDRDQQRRRDAATFKAPYPYRSPAELGAKHTGPFRPVPRRAAALHQPWTQTPARPKQHISSAFREHRGWGELGALPPEWDLPHYLHQAHLSGTCALHPGYPAYASRFSLLTEGLLRGGGGWEKPSGDGYVRQRGDKRNQWRAGKPPSPPEDGVEPTKAGDSLRSVSSDGRNSPSGSVLRDASENRFPWLLPHFRAGSLIELRDGRLRRVEHLQTEDFLLGTHACPDLRLSCCTVQSISPSASSSSVSRLLILLHSQRSQVKETELVPAQPNTF